MLGWLVGSTLIIVLKLLTGIELGNYFVHIFSGMMMRMLTVNGKLVDIESIKTQKCSKTIKLSHDTLSTNGRWLNCERHTGHYSTSRSP